MIIPTGRANEALSVHLNKIYKTNATSAVEQIERKDAVTISRLSALVEHGRTCAMALPEVRSDRVAQARLSLQAGILPEAKDIASSMMNRAAEGQV